VVTGFVSVVTGFVSVVTGFASVVTGFVPVDCGGRGVSAGRVSCTGRYDDHSVCEQVRDFVA
jgi:hypothetical protein